LAYAFNAEMRGLARSDGEQSMANMQGDDPDSKRSARGLAPASPREPSLSLDEQIKAIHRRYLEVMEGERLDGISDETKTHYLRVLRSLTDKLAVSGKPLSEVVGEMMAEAAPLLFQAMQR
jgi:hypothetical protein